MRGMVREMTDEVEAKMLKIQNGEHPVQVDIVREQKEQIADLTKENQRLKSIL